MISKFNEILLSKRNKYKILTDSDYKSETDFLNLAADILSSGADIIELRLLKQPTNVLLSVARKLRELSSYFNALLIIYDRIDIAKIVNADGIMLDGLSFTHNDANKLIENSMMIGYDATNSNLLNNISKCDFILANDDIKDINTKLFIIK